MDDFIVTVDDLRGLRQVQGTGYCIRGAKIFAERHNMDFDKFVREGLPASQFLATGDDLAAELVNFAKQGRRHG